MCSLFSPVLLQNFFIWWAELYKHQFFAMIFWRTDTDDVSTKAFFYHIKQTDSMLWVWTVIDPKWSQNMVGTSGHTQLHFRCKFLFLPHFDIISDLLLLLGKWGIYLLNFLQSGFYVLFCYEALLSGLQYHSFYHFFNLHIYIEVPLGVMGIKDIWVKN